MSVVKKGFESKSRKIAVVEKLVAATTEVLPIITMNNFETKSTEKG